MENLDLIISPTKLFEGTVVPRTSDQKPKKNSLLMDTSCDLKEPGVDMMQKEKQKLSTISSKTK
jgi:hypothetical protein